MRVYKHREPDLSEREMTERWGDGKNTVFTGIAGLYNENLTIGELSLLRHLLWDFRDIENKDGTITVRAALQLIKSWLLKNEDGSQKKLSIALDIKNAFDIGAEIDFDNESFR